MVPSTLPTLLVPKGAGVAAGDAVAGDAIVGNAVAGDGDGDVLAMAAEAGAGAAAVVDAAAVAFGDWLLKALERSSVPATPLSSACAYTSAHQT